MQTRLRISRKYIPPESPKNEKFNSRYDRNGKRWRLIHRLF
ncbi:hypothetical protein LEP1GSC133_4813 [Leptospira borgpetersenii serovar Pomona str. 200901868]|uniref:Uncharacterized protein n=1 Tax=Leptospira borgpetersenii serovar Pomona str. 200901868 TaxID=1192866 RepID=M6WE80_LEPBO|nr:hypothetical protein LEP1GSC133_4813 [Leptospira borgpetersenii serovar Pomona str. 200901868]